MNRQRLGMWGTFAFAALAVVGVLVQVYLIGGVAFGEGSGWLDAHKNLGKLVHLFYVLTFVSALVAAWPNWRKTGWPFTLAVVGTIQAFSAAGGNFGGADNAGNAGVHAFHATLVPIVFVIALIVAWRAWKELHGESSPQIAAT